MESGVEEEGISDIIEEVNGEGDSRRDVGEVGFDSDRPIEVEELSSVGAEMVR